MKFVTKKVTNVPVHYKRMGLLKNTTIKKETTKKTSKKSDERYADKRYLNNYFYTKFRQKIILIHTNLSTNYISVQWGNIFLL